MTVKRIEYNWSAPGEYYVGYEWYEVGKNNVTKIEEYPAMGDGDKWHYDIYFDAVMVRVFNVNKVYYI